MNDESTNVSISAKREAAGIGRKILRAFSVLFLVTGGALIAHWARSYHHADRLHGRFWERNSFLIASKQGRVTAVAFHWHGAPNWWTWGVRSFAVGDEMSFPVGSVRQYESALGFGTIADPMYMRSTFETPEGATILISALRGSGVIVPYWFLVLCFGLLAIALRLERPWRYTTRSLLIAITLVALVLGLSAGLDNRPDAWTRDIPASLDEL